MILIGADTHKHTHTLAAIDTPNGQHLGEKTIPASKTGFVALLDWARSLGDPERVWALEDCRHLTGPLERYLMATGERIVRIPPNLTARERGSRAHPWEVRSDRCPRDRQSRAAGGNRHPPHRPPGPGLAGDQAAARSSRGPHQSLLTRPTTTTLAPTRPLARPKDPRRSTRPRSLVAADLPQAHPVPNTALACVSRVTSYEHSNNTPAAHTN